MASLERTEKSKGGYDYEFVRPPSKSLECPVCLLTLRDPHVISCCGNEFCQVCIERVQRDGKPCPLCNEPKFTTFLHKKLVREVNALVVRCPQKELGCDWEGELGQLQSHLTSPGAGVVSSKGCGFVLVECAYQCGAQIQRRLLQEHEMEFCLKRPVEMQVASLVQKFEKIFVENQQLRQELEKIQKIHKEQLNQVKQELDEVKKKNDYLQKVNEDMQFKSKNLERKYASLQTHTMPLPVPPFYFTLPNVDQYQNVLATDGDPIYYSEPFYSHPGGYKMRVKVYPNGVDSSRGTSLGLYISILCGEFDDHLCWPFNGSITINVYNCTTKQWSDEYTIVMNEAVCGPKVVGRCVDVMAHGSWGFSTYLSFSELNTVKATNVIMFRITKVKICA